MQLKIPLFILVGAVLLGVAIVLMWVPDSDRVPEWAEERATLQNLVSGVTFTARLTYVISVLTGRNYLSTFRSVINIFKITEDLNSPSMKVSHTEMDGVPVHVFRPQPAPDSSPAIIFIHGGGWTILEADLYDGTCHHMAQNYNTVVLSISYRLAPEHPYPVPFEDCLKATMYILQNARMLGLDPDRIAIAGDSAGGNLAAAVALRLSQKDLADKLPHLQFQVLVYPALQMVDLNTHSYTNFSATGLLLKDFMTEMWLAYLGYPELLQDIAEFKANRHSFELLKNPLYASYLSPQNLPEGARVPGYEPARPESGNKALAAKVQSRLLDPYFCPLMAEDVSKVPPAYFIIANIDILRDDSLLYVDRLKKAGVKTVVDFYPAMVHGFFPIPSRRMNLFQEALKAFDRVGEFVKENL